MIYHQHTVPTSSAGKYTNLLCVLIFTCVRLLVLQLSASLGFLCVFFTLFGVKVGIDCVQQKRRNVFFQFLFQLDEDGSQTLETDVSGIYVLLAFIGSVSSILPVIVHLFAMFQVFCQSCVTLAFTGYISGVCCTE